MSSDKLIIKKQTVYLFLIKPGFKQTETLVKLVFCWFQAVKVVSVLACCSPLKTINSKQLQTDANHLINSTT